MRKLLVFLLFAPALFAANWSVTTTAAQDARANRELNSINAATCASVGLAANCAQTPARNAFCNQPGAVPLGSTPCTRFGVSSNTIFIYQNAGDYWNTFAIPNEDTLLKAKQDSLDNRSFQAWQQTASQAQKDAVCAAAGLAAGCLP